MRRPWPHPRGVTCLVLEPLDFLRRLAALIPAPYTHLVRYHGIFANRSRWRRHLPAPPCTEVLPTGPVSAAGEREAEGEASESTSPSPRCRTPLRWAQLLMSTESTSKISPGLMMTPRPRRCGRLARIRMPHACRRPDSVDPAAGGIQGSQTSECDLKIAGCLRLSESLRPARFRLSATWSGSRRTSCFSCQDKRLWL
ncbi:MAG: transposase [Candidatus Eisenbacteria sp.]|nr:transposase [Candidatus Eisenbacteria bacterium]